MKYKLKIETKAQHKRQKEPYAIRDSVQFPSNIHKARYIRLHIYAC